jgi:hypothetical protein
VKSLTIRLPEVLAAEIEAESRRRHVAKSDVVRERLVRGAAKRAPRQKGLESIADLIGSADFGPGDLSSRKKHYLRATGYGKKRPR